MKTPQEMELTKVYQQDKYLLEEEPDFLKWINEHLSCIQYQIEISRTKKEREINCIDLYKIQLVLKERIKNKLGEMKK